MQNPHRQQLTDGIVLRVMRPLVTLFISESGGLFGFSESGYRPAIIVEGSTVLLLAPVAAIEIVRALSTAERRRAPGRKTAPLDSTRARGAALPE